MFSKKLWGIALGGSFLCGAFLFTNSCTKEQVATDPVCFESDVQPIITTNCTGSGCHNSVDRVKGRDYSSYQGIIRDVKAGDYHNSELYQVMVATFGVMPPSPNDRVSTSDIRTIALWIEQGATNETCSTAACDTSGVMSYAADVKPLLQGSCALSGCHTGSAPASNISYATWAQTKTSALDGSLYGSIVQDGSYSYMPKGSSKFSNCNIAKIKKWIDAGAPNN